MQKFNISVKELVAFYYCEGSISSTFLGKSRANLGTSVHTQLQKSRPDNYLKEFYLQDEIVKEKYTLKVSGRADGVYLPLEKEFTIIEEIKSTYLDLNFLHDNPNKYHLAQLQVYAYLYLRDKEDTEIVTNLTYYNLI